MIYDVWCKTLVELKTFLRIDSYSYTAESTTLTYALNTIFETNVNVILDLLGRTALILITLTSEN